jgi:hypothetical protein
MRMLKEMPLSQFLKIREEPFADLDRAEAVETQKG